MYCFINITLLSCANNNVINPLQISVIITPYNASVGIYSVVEHAKNELRIGINILFLWPFPKEFLRTGIIYRWIYRYNVKAR